MENKTDNSIKEYLVLGFYPETGREDNFVIPAKSEKEAKKLAKELYPDFRADSAAILDEYEDED